MKIRLLKALLFADIPLSVLHFILFLCFGGFLGQPGVALAGVLGASEGGVLWWVLMVFNSLIWGAGISLIVLPFLRKILK